MSELTGIDIWFIAQLAELVSAEQRYAALESVDRRELLKMKRLGFSDLQLARLRGESESEVRERRWEFGMHPVYNTVDTCAGEFPAQTPYLYSTYADENESVRSDRRKVVILGSGPNRIGQGVEFDYCCVQASLALREAGWETIMVNSNPETVSTDFDISDKLYFEPLTLEDVLEIVRIEQPEGVIVQLGGQTPLKLAAPLQELGVKILGTSVESIDRGRGPGALRGAGAAPGGGAAAERRGHQRGPGGGHRRAHRLPRPAPSELRAGRARDGDRLR